MKSDKILSVLLMIISVGIFLYTLNFPIEAAIYPRVVLITVFILSIMLFISPQKTEIVGLKLFINSINKYKIVIFVFLITFVFILSMNYISFFIGLPVYMIVIQLVLGDRNIIKILIPTIIFTCTIYIIFVVILKIPMTVFS